MTAHVVGCVCDLPAKAILLNFIQFNGAYGCAYCEQSGESFRTEGGGTVRVFPYIVESPKGEQRTVEACVQHAKQAIETNAAVCAWYSCRQHACNESCMHVYSAGEGSQRTILALLFAFIQHDQGYISGVHALRSLRGHKMSP